jgi:hypothetical protein
VLCLTAPFLKSSLAIDMAKSIYDKIEKLANNNFDDIKDITKSDGTPLLPDEYKNNEDTLKELAKALKYLVDFRNDCRGNDICGTNVKSLTSNLKDVMYQETMILKITGGLLGATIGGIAGVNAFLGAALLVPKDPISEGFLFVGALISGIIGAIIGGAIGWTLITTITRTPIDEGTEPDKPPESCPGLIFSRVGCNGSMTFSNDMCANASSKLNVNHMFSSIDMILTFVGITPSDIPEWPTDNDDCVYNGYLY